MDYYSILGVSRTASLEQIKKSYRELALQYHPDKNPSPDANERFKRINEAYSILSDPNKRKYYDLGGAGRSVGMSFSFGNAMDMFNNIFRSDPFFSNHRKFMTDVINSMGEQPGNHFSGYSSSTFVRRDKDGNVVKTTQVKTNKNGKTDHYYQKYYIDKDGNKHEIKKEGNPALIGGNQSHKIFRLKHD